MFRTPPLTQALPLLLAVFAVACSHTPQMSDDNETDYIRMLRQEFFKTHPDGKFNESIAEGKIERGMDFLEVLASWGNPNRRKKPTPDIEYWVYREEDEDSKDWIEYKLCFRKNVLDDWELTRQVAGGDPYNMQSDTSTSLSKGAGEAGSGSAPQKK
jgi:hypothetical protein